MGDILSTVTQACFDLSSRLRTLGAEPRRSGCIATITLSRKVFLAFEHELRTASMGNQPFGDVICCTVHNGYHVEIRAEPATVLQ